MQKPIKFVAALSLAVTFAFPAQAEDANTVIATVNGKEITLGHMIVARASLPAEYQQLPDNVLFDGILKQLVEQSLLASDFKGDIPARIPLMLENEERSLLAAERVGEILDMAVSEEAINAAYEARFADAEPSKEYNASHILVDSEKEALLIKKELDEGANFAAKAKSASTGPSGPNGGALGWFGKNTMVPSFEEAVMALNVGEVSEPVQTQFGWHIITLNDVRNSEVPKLDDVREEIEGALRESALSEIIDKLRESATIDQSGSADLDPAILSDMSIIE